MLVLCVYHIDDKFVFFGHTHFVALNDNDVG